MADELRRDYSLSDSELCMFVSNLVQSITRDGSEFASKGVSALDVTGLETLGNAFEIFPPDSYYQADLSIAAEAKDAVRSGLEVKVRDIVQCAVVKWGEGSPQYKKFGTARMTNMGDMKFLTMCRQAVVTAGDYLLDLTAVGLTQAMIDAVAADAQTFEDDLNAVNSAVEARDIKTGERIKDGNELYSFVSKYCMIGKIIWDDVEEAKYNDYIIYPKSASGLGKVMNLAYDMPASTASWDALQFADDYQLEFKPSAAGAEWEVVYEGAGRSFVHDPGSGTWYYRCRGNNAEGYGDWSDELIVLIPV